MYISSNHPISEPSQLILQTWRFNRESSDTVAQTIRDNIDRLRVIHHDASPCPTVTGGGLEEDILVCISLLYYILQFLFEVV